MNEQQRWEADREGWAVDLIRESLARDESRADSIRRIAKNAGHNFPRRDRSANRRQRRARRRSR